MNILDILSEQLDSLAKAEENLKRIRTEYADEPDLLTFYEPSAQFLVDAIKNQLNISMASYVGDSTINEADVLIKLSGPNFEDGKAPLGVVGSFIKNLANANQHAVSLLENVKYEGRRITKRIKELAELNLVATAPGSLQLILRKPTNAKFLSIGEMENQGKISHEDYIFETIRYVKDEGELAVEGLKLLSKAIVASEDEEVYKELYEEVKEPQNMLKLLYYAKEITPSQTSDISEVTITNFADKENGKISKVVFNSEMRHKILERSKQLIKEGRYIEGGGIVRAVDFDKMNFRINDLNIGDETLNDIECKANKKYFLENTLEKIANKPVKLLGVLIYTSRGDPSYIDVDDVLLI